MAELYSPELYSAAQSIVVLFLPAESGGLTAGTFRGCVRNPLEARQEVDQFQEEHGYGERKGEYQRAKEGLSVGEREKCLCLCIRMWAAVCKMPISLCLGTTLPILFRQICCFTCGESVHSDGSGRGVHDAFVHVGKWGQTARVRLYRFLYCTVKTITKPAWGAR